MEPSVSKMIISGMPILNYLVKKKKKRIILFY